MILADHLLYVDITNVCNVGCESCMYKAEIGETPKNLVLTRAAEKNLGTLINDPETAHVIVSGEGEPFNNEPALKGILGLSKGNRYFQIVTNGAWANADLTDRLRELDQMAESRGDRYGLRVSLDSFHAAKISRQKYARFFQVASGGQFQNLNLAVRSLLEEREFTRDFIRSVVEDADLSYALKADGELDDELILGKQRVNITYKNLIHPDAMGIDKAFSIYDYIVALERKYKKTFTLGNLGTSGQHKGLDITVKPSGEVLFYGAELQSFGNIFNGNEEVSISILKRAVHTDPLLKALYSKPFREALDELSRNSEISAEIKKINNPYWIVRDIYLRYKSEFDKAFGVKYD